MNLFLIGFGLGILGHDLTMDFILRADKKPFHLLSGKLIGGILAVIGVFA